jgi:2,4-dienoyl-CoA reductase-like NADH-dependent reductase (Old Yellow Enzyme family)
MRAAQPFALAGLELRNRLVGTAHGRGILEDGLPLPEDAEYWRRVAAGGAAMLTVGGTVTAPESTWRRRITTEAWRVEAVPGMAARAEAIRAEGAVAACQLVHLGRETTGAEQWFHPVAPSAARSPREPTRPRPLSAGEVDAVVEGFRVSAVNAAEAGFQVIELHAAHGYLLAQFLAAERSAALVGRIVDEIRASVPGIVVGVRLSMDHEGGLTPLIAEFADYVNLTVGERTTYVRDMATEEPPLLDEVGRIRQAVGGPLLISHGFRGLETIEAALGAGADLVGMARALIADPDMPRKLLSGRAADVRPCVACNEDCRAFDPVLLCSVNPELGPPGADRRPAAPLVVRDGADGRPAAPLVVRRGGGGRVAIVGAGPAGLECAVTLAGRCEVALFDAGEAIGGQLAVAAAAPHRRGWRALLDFYAHGLEAVDVHLDSPVAANDLGDFDEVVLAVGATEVLPAVPGIDRALPSSQAIGQRLSGRKLLVVDDGFGWWPCASAVELGVQAGFERITVATPAAAFGGSLPPEGRVQLLARLRGAPLDVRPFTALTALGERSAVLTNTLSGAAERVSADTVIVVGERVARDWRALVPPAGSVRVIGDALVPRKASHAIAEGRAAAESIAPPFSTPSRLAASRT